MTNQNEQPKCIIWFKVYCGFMALMYLFIIVFGLVLLVFPEQLEMNRIEALVTGFACLVVGLVLFIPFLMGIFLKPKPWVWIFDIVLICIGFTSCLTLAFSIPLFIFWIKPDLKAYFGR